MMANSPADILAELEEVVATYPPHRCARILAGMVQLLTGSRGQCRELLVNVVDGVLLRLTERVETSALVQLSMALAELDIAPPETLWRLASHDNRTWRGLCFSSVVPFSRPISRLSLTPVASGIDARSPRAATSRRP